MKPATPSAVCNSMSAIRLQLPTALRAVLAGTWLLIAAAASLSAATGGFVSTLSAGQQSAAGLPGLSDAERASLDQLVGSELAMVRQGQPEEITGTFLGRRTEAELTSAGLDRLTAAQKARLNEYIAAALATHPKPKERPRLKDDDVINPASQPQIHGSVSLTVGTAGSGRNFWGSSLWLDYYDPARGFGLSVGLSNFSGKGYYGYWPEYYGPGFYGDLPYYSDLSYRGPFRSDAFAGDGMSLRTQGLGDSAGWYGRRHH